MKRVMVFIDGSNLYFGLKEHLGRHKVDFAAVVAKLAGPDRKMVRAYYYNCPISRQEDEDAIAVNSGFSTLLNASMI